MLRIITNADDFGQNEDCTRATIECLEKGWLTSATIMANTAATSLAAEFARSRPDLSFGAHLTYVLGDNTERPVLAPEKVACLTQGDGRFMPSQKTRVRALLGRLDVGQIADETAAQVGRLRSLGVALAHVDSHGHLHRFGPFREALRRVLPGLGISRVRSVQDVYIRKPLKSPNYWFGPVWRGPIRRLFQTSDHFYMPTSAGDREWWGPLLDMAAAGKIRGTIEVGVHPGRAEAWRAGEFAAIEQFAREAKKRGHALIGWKDL